jgi:serine/threonine protein kinase/tetratricopeptide (TPR) repeat protein
MIGQTVSHYRILEKLGGGGMGVVYRAHDERLDRDVALKVLPAGLLADETARSRFRREALTLSQLNQPNIAVVHDFDSENGVDFLTMEYVVGETLATKVAAGALPESEVIVLGVQIGEALEEAHEHGIIHRDLKPANVMVTAKGRAKVLDFGLAKLVRPTEVEGETASLAETQAGAVMGTVPYMSPEQLQGKTVDARADIYALGALLYELATARRPFPEKQSSHLIAAILTQAPQPPRELNGEVSPGLEAIILKALQKNPDERYRSAKEVLEDFGRLSIPGSAVGLPRQVSSKRWVPTAVGVAAIIAALAIVLVLNVGGLRSRIWPGSGAGSVATLPKIQSLAVLPLENLSGDPKQDYFADGMTEELITDLSKVGALKVISRTAMMRYKGTKKSLPEIAKELNVDAVIEGSVLREGERVRITAHLINAATQQDLWADSYERDMSSVLALQGEIASTVAGKVQVALTPDERSKLASTRTVNPQAYDAYLKGRYHWNRRNEQELRKGLEYFQQALQADPNYAQAYSGLADAYILLNIRGYDSPAKTNPAAMAAARKAIALGNGLCEAHTSLARALMNDWDWQEADQEFRRAIDQDPSNVEVHHAYSHYLAAMGRIADSISEAKRAIELAPLDSTMIDHLGWVYVMTRQYEKAVEQNQEAIDLDPNNLLAHFQRGQAFEGLGQYKQAEAEFQRAQTLNGTNPEMLVGLGHLYAVSGNRANALRILSRLNTLSSKAYVSTIDMAIMHAGLGEREQAMAWLEKAYAEHNAGLAYLEIDPRFDPLRSDLRFQALVRKLNLPE